MASVIIYQDQPDNWQFHGPTQEMRNYGGATKKLIYVDRTLCVVDYDSGARLVIIPISRRHLVGIGLKCIVTALRK
jgi:hypothetical protein